jgi:hypothetical protein
MNASFLWNVLQPELPDENKWNLIRGHRNELLARCDWTQIPDAALTLEEKQSWAAYRQSLRNIPQDFQLADDVIFPNPPGA